MLSFVPNGDAALLIYIDDPLATEVSEDVLHQVTSVTAALKILVEKKSLVGVIDIVPAYRSVMLHYDLRQTDFYYLQKQLHACFGGSSFEEDHFANDSLTKANQQKLSALPVVEIPVCYHESLGVDIAELAQHCNLSIDEVIARHTAPDYTVYMLGFMPGFLYLGGLDETLAAPRRSVPREKIIEGSVGIAGQQTGIYPFASPGGWQIIGRTPQLMFDSQKASPALVEPGQKVRFVPISLEDFYDGEHEGGRE